MKLPQRLIPLAIAFHVSLGSALGTPQFGRQALDPRTDVSASGKYSLHVEPSSPEGRGKARYRLEHEGKQAWSAELPYTLWESVVSDDGSVAGYAYGNGIDGWSGVRGEHGLGDVRVVVLDPSGSPRANVSTERTGSSFMHEPPQPLVAGLLLDSDTDRVVFRIGDEDVNRSSEEWWPFRLSTGAALPKFRPKEHMEAPEPARWVLAARHVPKTPLILLHWWTFHDDPATRKFTVGGRFTLVDLDGAAVWSLDLPSDYTRPGDEAAEDRLQNEMRRTGAILGCAEPGRFEIGLVTEAKRVTFEATADATAKTHWKVVEIARADWSREPPPPAKPAALAEGHLEQVRTIELGGPAHANPQLGPIFHFDVDDRGRFGFVRKGEDKLSRFILASPEGKVLADVPVDLGAAGADYLASAEWIAKDRWILYMPWPAGGNENPAWWFDVETKQLEPIAGFQEPGIKSIDGDGKGGFVALTTAHHKYTMEQTVEAFDATGKSRWKLGEDYEDKTKPLSPEEVAVAPNGHVGVLDNIRKLVIVYAPDGSYIETIDLEKSWGWEPNYPSGIAADANSGWIVHDFDGRPPLVRMSSTGEVVAKLEPAFPDGRKLDLRGRVVAALDGGLWTTDQHAFLHLNAQGQVDRIAGSAPDPDRIESISGVAVDPKGRILLGDERTGAVHVFDGKGTKLFVCRPAPNDEQGCEQIAGAADGRIFAGGEKGFVCYSPGGERTGTAGKILESMSEQWMFQPQGGKRWVVDYSGVALADEQGKIVRKLEKRPDGTWLTGPRNACIAPDGSLAVISGSLCIYAPDGKPLQTIAMPEETGFISCIAFDGKRVVLDGKDALLVRDATKGEWKRYPFPTKISGLQALFFSQDGERIQGVEYGSPRLIEYRLLD